MIDGLFKDGLDWLVLPPREIAESGESLFIDADPGVCHFCESVCVDGFVVAWQSFAVGAVGTS